MRAQTLDVRAVRRALVVMLAADRLGNRQTARELGIGRIQTGCWRDRFAAGGLAAIAGLKGVLSWPNPAAGVAA